MSALSNISADIRDALVDVVTGPVLGTVAVATLGDRVLVPRGTMATLPDGRRIRVTRNTYVDIVGNVPVRLEHLTPTFPAAGNYRDVTAGTVATWVDPPAGIEATGTTSAFGSGSRASTMKILCVAEHDSPDAFPAGAQGTAALILVSPNLRSVAGPGMWMRGVYEATWRLRLNLNDTSEQPLRRTRARDAIEAIGVSIIGATVGDDVVRIGQWTSIRDGAAWEATLLTRVSIDGRVLQEEPDAIDGLDVTVLLPDDEEQPDPFRVEDSTLL